MAPMVLSPAIYWTAKETTSGNYGVGPGIYGVILVNDMLEFNLCTYMTARSALYKSCG